MSCRTNLALSEQNAMLETTDAPQQMDRSVAYEMINDFGAEAFLKVVSQYQENMARNMELLNDRGSNQDGLEQVWALQYIRNCSAQLGLSTVSLHCKRAMDELLEHAEPDTRLSPEEHQQFEKIIDHSVGSLRSLCAKMQLLSDLPQLPIAKASI